jgi:hypothetical protein
MSNPFYELCCHGLKQGELLSKILQYEFEYNTKKGGMCVTMISFSQPGFMGSNVQCNTTDRDKQDA